MNESKAQSAHTYVNSKCMDKSNSNTNWLTNNNNSQRQRQSQSQSQWKHKQTNENKTRFQFTFYLIYDCVLRLLFHMKCQFSYLCDSENAKHRASVFSFDLKRKECFFCSKKSKMKNWHVHQDVPAEIVPSTKKYCANNN